MRREGELRGVDGDRWKEVKLFGVGKKEREKEEDKGGLTAW